MSAPENPGGGRRDDGDTGRPEFTHRDRQKAVEKAREQNGEWKINRKKIDGEQLYVVERRVNKFTRGGANVEVWRED